MRIKGTPPQVGDIVLTDIVSFVTENLGYDPETVAGVYLNWYKNGSDFTPNHSHKDTVQIIVSLGSKRTLTVGKKEYPQKSGTVTVFGASVHGVPKSDSIEGRISIAIFIDK